MIGSAQPIPAGSSRPGQLEKSTDETLASRLLGEYGDNERIASAFFSEYLSGI